MSVADKLDVARKSLGRSNVAKAVCKATSREIMGPKKKHVDYLLVCTDNELMNLTFMSDMLLERCAMSSWVIVSKALVTFHSIMSNGNERFFQQLAARTALWDLENFLDKTAVIGYDMSSFIKRYSKYLMQKVHSYREMNYDFCRAKRGADGVLRTLEADKLLKALVEVQTQLDSLLAVDLQSSEFSNGVINSAFVLLFKDLIKLFACYNDGMINLLEKFYVMNKENCKESLEIYKKFLTRTDQVSKFLTVAQDIGVSEDAIPDLAKAPSSLLDALECHYKSLEKGQVPVESETHLNLAPINISLKSEQFNFKEEEIAEPLSPEDNNNETVDNQPTLLETVQSTNPGGDGPWQTLFEPAEVPQTNTTPEPSSKQNDLLELHAVFQAQQPPATNAFPPSSNFGAPGYNSMTNQPVRQTTNPFEIHSEQQSSGDVLLPMNKPQSAQQQQHGEMQRQRQSSTGDLHSSLSKVAKSLDNFDLTSVSLGTGSSGHQWTAPKPKVKTGGANFQMGTTGTTLPPGNPVSSNPHYNAPPSSISPTGPPPVVRPGNTQPVVLGPTPSSIFSTDFGMGQPPQTVRPGNSQPLVLGPTPSSISPTGPPPIVRPGNTQPVVLGPTPSSIFSTDFGMGQPPQTLRPGNTQPQTFGPRPVAYGQQPMMRPQTTMYAPPRANTNPFGNPGPALF